MDSLLNYSPRIFLGLVALAFLFFGVLGLINPVGTVAPLDIVIQTAQAKTEIRATYGGLLVGIALMLAYTAINTSMLKFGMISTMLMLYVIGLTRLYGILVDGTQSSLQWQLLVTELIPATIALLLLIFHPLNKL